MVAGMMRIRRRTKKSKWRDRRRQEKQKSVKAMLATLPFGHQEASGM